MSDEKTSLTATDDPAFSSDRPSMGAVHPTRFARPAASENVLKESPLSLEPCYDFLAASVVTPDLSPSLGTAVSQQGYETSQAGSFGIVSDGRNSDAAKAVSLTVPQSLGRTITMFLFLGPAYLFCFWLVLTCADFFDVARVGRGLTRPWTDFAARISFAVLLPPAIIAAFDARRPVLLRLREAARASLITFLCFAVLFFAVGGLAVRFASGMNVGLIPELLRRTAPLTSCLLLYVSYQLIAAMLPLPVQTTPPPRPVRLFLLLAVLLVLTLPIQALAPLAPFGLPALPVFFYDVHALPQDLFLFVGVAWLLHRKGLRAFRPIWVVCCLFGPLLLLRDLTVYPLPWQIFHLVRAGVAVLSCVCLYTPRARRWLVV